MTAIKTLENSIESGLNVFGTNTFMISKVLPSSSEEMKNTETERILISINTLHLKREQHYQFW